MSCVLALRELQVSEFFSYSRWTFLVKFLSEGELDSRARLAGPAAEQAQSEDMVRFLRSSELVQCLIFPFRRSRKPWQLQNEKQKTSALVHRQSELIPAQELQRKSSKSWAQRNARKMSRKKHSKMLEETWTARSSQFWRKASPQKIEKISPFWCTILKILL